MKIYQHLHAYLLSLTVITDKDFQNLLGLKALLKELLTIIEVKEETDQFMTLLMMTKQKIKQFQTKGEKTSWQD